MLIQYKKQTMKNIIIFGPPGTGKGTVSKRLSEEFRLKHISTGDIIRKNQEEKTNFYEDAFGGMPTFDDMGKNVADKFNSIGDFAKEVSNNVKKDLNIQSIKDDIIKEIRKNFKL